MLAIGRPMHGVGPARRGRVRSGVGGKHSGNKANEKRGCHRDAECSGMHALLACCRPKGYYPENMAVATSLATLRTSRDVSGGKKMDRSMRLKMIFTTVVLF